MFSFFQTQTQSMLTNEEGLPTKGAQGRYLVVPEILGGDWSWWYVLILRGTPRYLNPALVTAITTCEKGYKYIQKVHGYLLYQCKPGVTLLKWIELHQLEMEIRLSKWASILQDSNSQRNRQRTTQKRLSKTQNFKFKVMENSRIRNKRENDVCNKVRLETII